MYPNDGKNRVHHTGRATTQLAPLDLITLWVARTRVTVRIAWITHDQCQVVAVGLLAASIVYAWRKVSTKPSLPSKQPGSFRVTVLSTVLLKVPTEFVDCSSAAFAIGTLKSTF